MVEGTDSNHRKAEPADLQSAPFGHSGTPPNFLLLAASFISIKRDGADYRNRTGDLLITSQLLYLLS